MALNDAYVLAELDGRVVAANRPARRLLTGDEATLPPAITGWTTDPELAAGLLATWAATSTPRPASLTLPSGRTLRADGARLGEPDRLLVRVRDREESTVAYTSLTVRRRSEQLRAISRQLDTTVARLHEANRELRFANEQLQQYAAAVAHDVRTPLFTIRGFIQMLQDGDHVDADGAELVEQIVGATDRLHRTTESLLAVARLEEQLPVTDPVSITAALHEALAEQRRELDAASATVVEEGLDGLQAAVPAISLRQVFHNLVTNSLRFREPSRPLRLEVHARELGDLVEVAVTDNGTGIDERDRDHLFELFQRGTRRETTPGHGIGLATCRKLVTRWGGSIRCESSSEPGARFVFTAPARVGASRPGLV
jgi:signal transduction histidine kinase